MSDILTGVIGRVDAHDSRWYVDPITGAELQSVTTALSATKAKGWLAGWSAGLAAQFCVENLDLIRDVMASDAGKSGAAALIKDAAKRKRELLRDMGTYQHDVFEALILDTPIPTVPEHLAGIVVDGESVDQDTVTDGFMQFVEDFDPEFLMAEATVANPEMGYAGTLDIVARLRRRNNETVLLDSKTGSVLDVEVQAQLAAYRRCTEVWLTDHGDRAPMPQVDRAGILHVRTDYRRGYKVLDQPTGEQQFRWFLRCLRLLEDVQAAPKVFGRPLYPLLADGSEPPMLVEDIESEGLGRCKGALAAAGVHDVQQLAALAVDDLLAIKGVGESAVHAVIAALVPHGLTVSGPLPCTGGTVPSVHTVARKVVGDCPACGQQVSASREGATKFHTAPMAVAA